MFKKFKVRTVLFSSFALFIIVLFSVVILVSYRIMVNEMVTHTTAHQEEALGLYSNEINNQLRAVEEMSLMLSTNSTLQNFLQGTYNTERYYYQNQRSNVHSYLYQVILSMSLVESIDVYMDQPPAYDQQLPIRYLSILDLHDHPENETYIQGDEGWLGLHQKHLQEDGEEIVSYSRNIYSPNGNLRGVLVLNIPILKFRSFIEGNGDYIRNRVLLDSNQQMIAAVGHSELASEFNKWQSVFESEKGKQESEQGLMVWSPLNESGWKLVELTPREELTGGGARMAKVLFALGLAAMISALFATYFLSVRFTRPILVLLSAMRHYGQEEKLVVPRDYHNEFGKLFAGFERMTQRIKKLHRSLEEQSYLQRQAEISALQANINPHFLYNTLDQLNWMAIARNQQDMSKVIELTGNMLRIGLSKGKSLIPITDELAHIQYYMEIQQYRLSEGFTYEFRIEQSTESYYVPKFTLQPLIENAIIHGFHRRNKGQIRVTIKEYENSLLIEVTDNGCGFNTENISKRGYGIENVEKRIKAFFGEEYGITLWSKQGVGTIVKITLAKQKNDQIRGGDVYVENRDH
ncbi:cache domain-containing sensor histidine kinase [Alkalicoccobacillus porphyridii]|uniref:Sensor histidine kinase n=1 Tax=Alkalicoccobacillus porphyridii TaxID=2597270 RepID=A0A554A2H6_9BACI|nr:sensor histidine kinase [Alkalicoccobacillus porphyridii]TSB47893.1 sensor histidine kinase [Alkalicoccobacillus porphyridii]